MNTHSERRNQHRYKAEKLKVFVRSILATEWEKGLISTVDFNRHGIALDMQKSFAIGDTLTILIFIDDTSTTSIKGLVCNRAKTSQGFRLGIGFVHDEFESNDNSLSTDHELVVLEERIAALNS